MPMKTSKNISKIVLVLIAFASFAYATGCSDNLGDPTATVSGRTFLLEIAADPDSRYTGLSGRAPLLDNQAMLFIYPDSKIRNFCMRNCVYPIDIMFADATGKIVQTYAMQPQHDLIKQPGEADEKDWESYSSVKPIVYALEVRGGLIKELNIKPGDKIILKNVIDYRRAK